MTFMFAQTILMPEGMYFMMGDNRDDSDDSRYWGYVPEENFIGRAFGVWMSWDANQHKVRWNRIGKKVS
jgi:signal peptidase I